MEGGGGSGNKTTGGLAGFFGAGGAGYSHADLAGVPLTGMNPLSPYLNVDPRYLVQDTDEGPSNWTIYALPGYSRKLDLKWRSQDSYQCPYGMPALQVVALPSMPLLLLSSSLLSFYQLGFCLFLFVSFIGGAMICSLFEIFLIFGVEMLLLLFIYKFIYKLPS
uniref:Uncharacterized protein n=1 Tax=Oryctolagus cuniculus TaxID=9986 RepID=G1TVN0_RABIT